MNKLFEIRDIDEHFIVFLFGKPILRKKHKVKNYDRRLVREWGLNTLPRATKVTVSMTTFPARIGNVHSAIENLLTQTIKPDRLILWLTEKEFPNREKDLPESLLNLQKFGLTIGWCGYMRSYQKLIPALINYPDDIIVTLDDDFYYPETVLEDLYFSYLKHPKDIHANRTWRGRVSNGKILTNSNSKMLSTKYYDASYKNLLMGYGGVLYPPHSLSNQVFDENKFKSLIFTHDDVWFWAMSVLKKTKTRQVRGFDFSLETIENSQAVGLYKFNGNNAGGITPNMAINIMLHEFPQIEQIMSEEC